VMPRTKTNVLEFTRTWEQARRRKRVLFDAGYHVVLADMTGACDHGPECVHLIIDGGKRQLPLDKRPR
jgi:hypothetical protein